MKKTMPTFHNWNTRLPKFVSRHILCKNRLIYEQEELYPLDKHEYKAEDGKAWGANEAYRLYDLEYGVENKYLLCYDNLLVEIDFDWEPTAAQKAVVSEKLGSLK